MVKLNRWREKCVALPNTLSTIVLRNPQSCWAFLSFFHPCVAACGMEDISPLQEGTALVRFLLNAGASVWKLEGGTNSNGPLIDALCLSVGHEIKKYVASRSNLAKFKVYSDLLNWNYWIHLLYFEYILYFLLSFKKFTANSF